MSTNKALVVGAHGVIGRSVAEYLSTRPGWSVVGASRRTAQNQKTLQHLSVDLLDPEDCTAKLSELHDITHLIFAAYVERPTSADLVKVNVVLLQNLLDAVERSSPHLRHVTLYQGGKAYGCHLGPFKTPAREDDPRYLGINFYYEQEDLLRTRQQRANWSWTIFRPEAVCGFAVGNPMNLSMVIAVYASISRELGLPLRFPGTPDAYTALYQVTSWGFGDAIFHTNYDNVTSTIKLRRAGFPDCIDTEEMFCTLFDQLRLKRIIP
jgi:nucleoside-diphosphate-sugar epimerase